jgi:hypothetical protein
MRAIMFAAVIAAALSWTETAAAQDGRVVVPDTIEAVTLHRLHREFYMCGEHLVGELQSIGDALGTDCVIHGGLDPEVEGGFVRAYRGDGARNEDWYGWNAEVLAPFDGTVRRIRTTESVNQPGVLGRPPASMLIFERADGVMVGFGHVQDLQVAEGDTVRAGQFVARVGNNGYGRSPHIHVGAWKGQTPYQIRWDLHRPAAAQ